MQETGLTPDQCRETEFAEAITQGIYLNHAGVSPTPARVARAVSEAITLGTRDPEAFFIQNGMAARDSARVRLARLMGVPAEHLALTKNTGHGLSIVADGLICEPGDNVVSANCEYPAVVYPWYAQVDRGIETRLAAPRPDGTIALDDIAALCNLRTRAITLSWVQFGTGFRADLAAFADLAHAHNALFIVDVIQGLGTLPLNSAALGLDIVVTGSHKWLLAPAGTGGLYVAPHVLDKLRLVNMGAASVVDVAKFDPLDFTPKPNAQRYEEGSPNSLGLYGLDAALSLLENVGIETVAARILSLTALGAELLEKKNYRLAAPRDDASCSGLLCFRHRALPNEAVLLALTNANIKAAVRSGNVRLSPHFYNTEDEIAQAVAALPD